MNNPKTDTGFVNFLIKANKRPLNGFVQNLGPIVLRYGREKMFWITQGRNVPRIVFILVLYLLLSLKSTQKYLAAIDAHSWGEGRLKVDPTPKFSQNMSIKC
jgi:hypothetical protein